MAYLIAAYDLSPSTGEQAFVDGFPQDSAGIMLLWFVAREVPGLRGSNPYGVLADSAARGNRKALRKLLFASQASDGGPAEGLADDVSRVARVHALWTLQELATLPPAVVNRVVEMRLPWCDSYKAIGAVSTSNATLRRLQQRLVRSGSTGC
ncbi:MAG: hypothetical protein JO103_10780 [Candidatus Eremiobacteraeota bacterium]|nr:hypothetical protein [Candidatus Eremiobacteraeota bacterium]